MRATIEPTMAVRITPLIPSDSSSGSKSNSRIAAKAWEICGFDGETSAVKASYDDLLTYYNQRDHGRIDRGLIRNALALLRTLRGEVSRPDGGGDYEACYQNLLLKIDPSSSTERVFLDALHARGLRLPDKAQFEVSEVYVRPDFAYGKKVAVFCDGSPHDNSSVKAKDAEKRALLKDLGWQVLVWRYDDNLELWLAKRPDIFCKVKA